MTAEEQEISRRFFGALVNVARTQLTEAQMAGLVAGTGLTLDDLGDEAGWVSREFFEVFLERLVHQWGSDEVIQRAGEVTFSAPNFGFLASVFRSADPGPNYRQAVEVAALFNKAGSFQILHESARSMDLAYTPIRPSGQERTRFLCLIRRHQLASVPRLLGLPKATVAETECSVRGDPSCLYQVQWQSARPKWGQILGVAGLALALLTLLLWHSAVALAVLPSVGLCALLGGLGYDSKRRLRELENLAEERGVAVRQSTTAIEQKYVELLSAKQAVDLQVEARTVELKNTGIALEHSLGQLTEISRQKDRFFENISHELRTPLTLILGPLESALQGSLNGGELTQTLQTMRRSGRRLHRLINQLLDLARVDAGHLKLNVGPIDLKVLLEGLLSQFEPLAKERGIVLGFNAPGSAAVLGDSERLEEVFVNLLGNALKFTPRQGTVSVTIETTSNGFEVAVRDSGIGIPPSDLERIFDRFARVEGEERAEGTGIGLALARELVKLHHGDIRALSQPKEGSTFVVSLPSGVLSLSASRFASRQAGAAPRDASSQSAPFRFETEPTAADSPTGEPQGEGPLVFLVEDHTDLRNFMQSLLAKRFCVHSFGDAESCLKALDNLYPEVIVSDVMMPGMNGVEFAARVKSDPRRRSIRMILATALAEGEQAVAGLVAGADDYVRKPFSPEELLARVSTQVELKGLTRQLINLEKRAVLGTFAAGLAHEVRNPATAIQGCLEPLQRLIKRNIAEVPASLDEVMRTIGESAKRITSLVRDVQDFAQLDRGQVRSYCLSDGIETCLRILAHRQGEKVELVKRLDHRDEIMCQASLVNQALMNLLDNAMRAVGESGKIEVTTEASGDGVAVSVRDSGPGMDPETLRRAFDPFFTTRDLGEGTGLGLPLSKQIAEAHGGRLSLTSAPGAGTLAVFWLPNEARPEALSN